MRTSAVLAIATALLVSTVLVSSFVTGVVPGMERASPLPPRPHASGSSAKTVVADVFTGTWCPPCANADPALSRLMDEYDPSRLVVLMWHLGGSDPYTNSYSNARANFYGIQYVPTIIVDGGGPYSDGTLWAIGADSSKAANYNSYKQKIDTEFGPGTSLSMSLAADLTPNTVNVQATITATDDPGLSNLAVKFVLYEDSLYFMGSNGEPYHRAVVRAVKEQPLGIALGETKTVTDSFMLNPEPTWLHNKLGVAALVQTNTQTRVSIYVSGVGWVDHYKAEVLQAARVDFVKPGIMVYRNDGLTDYTEPMERFLGKAGQHFGTWDNLSMGDTGANDVRGPPDSAGLAAHPLFVWYTAARTSSTLSATDQALLQAALTSGNGGLLVTGENIGTDIGATSFYQNVLKASYGGDDPTATGARGVTGDPVSGPWASTTLTFVGTSADIANPAAGASTMFTYVPSGQSAAVRSDYDSDSRVAYMGFRLFEWAGSGQSSDTAPENFQRMQILSSAVAWFDGIAGPSVAVTYPNGGEVFTSGTAETLRWDARDVVIPSDGVDLYYTADSGNPTWNLIAQNEPNDGVFRWDPPAGVDSDLCRLKVVVRDGQGNVREDISDADFTIGSPVVVPFSVVLQPGRNLVSFPVQPSDTVLTTILSSIDPNFAWVRVYDPTNPTDPWVAWTRNGPPNELTRLDRTMGFWVEITSPTPVTLTVQGLRPSVTTIPLVAGWNLVGFPSGRTDFTVAMAKAATGATVVSGFDSTSPSYMRVMANSEFLTAGNGYWVYVPSNRDWVVTY